MSTTILTITAAMTITTAITTIPKVDLYQMEKNEMSSRKLINV